MIFSLKYLISYVLDLIFGDPYWFPHPVRFIGKLIEILEKVFYKCKYKKISGGIMAIITIVVTFIISYYIAKISEILEIFFLYTTLATTSLAKEGNRVYGILKNGDLTKAKKELSYLVSRDTQDMDILQIIRGILETISENTVDGVIAPMFFALIGSFFYIDGVSLALSMAMGYKAINTLDSMVGYKNDRYIDYGMISAKIDDIANFIPARVTGGIIVPIGAFLLRMDYKRAWKVFFRDRLNHSSPNSAHSESAFAGALGVQFGGKTSYFGKMYDKQTIGDKTKEFELEDIKRAIKLLYISSVIGLVLFGLISQMIEVIIQ